MMMLRRKLYYLTTLLAVAGTAAYGLATGHRAGAVPGHQITLSARSAASTNWGKPVFTYDFNGTTLNHKKWSIYDDPTATGSHPRRTTASVRVRNGRLELIGHYQKPYGYVSGGISYNGNQTYGRWVVRFRADAGAGYAPVVLLWPKGRWPNDGEIDMAEITNVQRRGGNEFLHLGAENRFIGHPLPPSTDFTRWHILAVNWLPGHHLQPRRPAAVDGEPGAWQQQLHPQHAVPHRLAERPGMRRRLHGQPAHSPAGDHVRRLGQDLRRAAPLGPATRPTSAAHRPAGAPVRGPAAGWAAAGPAAAGWSGSASCPAEDSVPGRSG